MFFFFFFGQWNRKLNLRNEFCFQNLTMMPARIFRMWCSIRLNRFDFCLVRVESKTWKIMKKVKVKCIYWPLWKDRWARFISENILPRAAGYRNSNPTPQRPVTNASIHISHIACRKPFPWAICWYTANSMSIRMYTHLKMGKILLYDKKRTMVIGKLELPLIALKEWKHRTNKIV